ncbi:MAG: gliding motility-associated C-terminal domain-containing protein [Flavobacteriales bacterium]
MKDNVDKLFQERFSGHEVPVDPALWAAIEGQLLVTAATTDPVNELFRERFQGHEQPVDPAVWEGIGRQLGHAPPPASTSVWTWAASAAAVVVVSAGLWWSTTEAPSPVAEQRTPPSTVVAPPVEAPAADVQGVAAPVEGTQEAVDADRTPTAAVPEAAPKATAVPSSPSPTGLPVPREQVAAEPTVAPAAAPPTRPEDVPSVPASSADPASVPDGMRTAESDPQRVEAIIQEISERTVNEARSLARTDVTAPPPQQAPVENAPEAPELFMPNTFTPNGDGVNDTYVLDMEGFAQMSIRVLSLRTDKLVFSTMSGEPWTGAGCEDGMYVVVVEAVSEDGRNLSKAKVVWLTRERMN